MVSGMSAMAGPMADQRTGVADTRPDSGRRPLNSPPEQSPKLIITATNHHGDKSSP
jgi:hypothetical protein